MNELNFSLAFKALTDYGPLRWQIRLYDRLLAGEIPLACDLPTGLGKTSVIPIWLIALASQLAVNKTAKLPRRLIYIVNRRTVVDQATEIAERLRSRILRPRDLAAPESRHTLERLTHALEEATVASADMPLAISTLRGELADNEEWKADPARPAIIIGTIDMVGSKLLFSGYGDGFRLRPHHAGLVGQDALVIHDEAHLTPAFGTLLRGIHQEQRKMQEPRPVHVMELSATVSKTDNGSTLSLETDDEKDDLVRARLDARKSLVFHDADPEREFSEQIAECAWKYEAERCKVLIYVRSPVTAQQIVHNLKKRIEAQAEERVALLAGTIRGYERDQLVRENAVYRALLNHDSQVEQTVFLVSTSAGEVGIDLDSEHMVCDQTTLDAMIQRLGRLNRRGGKNRIARIDVFIAKKAETKEKEATPLERAESDAKSALEQLPKLDDGGYDASPRALGALLAGMSWDEKMKAFAPKPPFAPLTDVLLDAWALTTVRGSLPGRPEVTAYLHGLTADPPETYVVWRLETSLLAEANIPKARLREWFQRCRIEARERLHDRTNRVAKELQKIAKRGGGALSVILLTERGEAEVVLLGDLLQRGESALQYRTIVLPTETGGLTGEGILDGGLKEVASDVAEAEGKRARVVITGVGDTYWHWPLAQAQIQPQSFDEGEAYSSIERGAARIAQGFNKVVSQLIPIATPSEEEEDEGEARYLLLAVAPRQAAMETPESAAYEHRPLLDEHLELAGWWAERIARALHVDESLKDALVAAARWHDRGKDRRRWQYSVFNNEGDIIYAKSGPRGMDWRRLGGYRHEFGSLLDAAKDVGICDLPESDLILHLIGAHHGRGRPHFESDAWDVERHTSAENLEAAQEVMRRFGRLQQRFGRWGLAWLESLLRCADVLASAQAAQLYPGSEPEERYEG